SDVITVVFTEPMNELDFRNQANYVLSAPTGVTVPELTNTMFKIDNKTVVLTYAANIPAGSTVTVKGVKDLAGNTMSEVGNSATVDKVSSSIAGFVGSTQVTVFFSANMDKVSAENAANYVLSSGLALLAENGVVYDAANNSVTLTYVSAIPAGVTLTVSGVKDANGTVVDSNTKTFN
ncbi:MAG TPA: Ig-like domain-containing protein, partial [Agitococcus sp.]|nr:Ig-like domain-containing protein [Agitococcus sp.]